MMELSCIRSILVISLSNIGDVILTFPVLDILRRDFPHAQLSVVVGPKGESLLKGNPHLQRVIVFQKRQSWPEFLAWLRALKEQEYDLVVDLRNTVIPFLLKARYRTSLVLHRVPGQPMVRQHLERLRSVYPFRGSERAPSILTVEPRQQQAIREIMAQQGLTRGQFFAVAPGAAALDKRWGEDRFALLSDRLMARTRRPLAFVGDTEDLPVTKRIMGRMNHPAVNLCGQTTLPQLAEVISACRLLIVNDSAPLHLASYLGVPVVGIFGPTDPQRYGPWGDSGVWVARKDSCPACRRRKKLLPHTCLNAVTVEDVWQGLESTSWGRSILAETA